MQIPQRQHATSLRSRLRKQLFWQVDRYNDWVAETGKPDWMFSPDVVQIGLCIALGHNFIPDQCGIPEHDYCSWCLRSTPSFRNSSQKGTTQ